MKKTLLLFAAALFSLMASAGDGLVAVGANVILLPSSYYDNDIEWSAWTWVYNSQQEYGEWNDQNPNYNVICGIDPLTEEYGPRPDAEGRQWYEPGFDMDWKEGDVNLDVWDEETEQALAEQYLESIGFDSFGFYGGYENSERKVLCLDYYDDDPVYPISAMEFKFRQADKLTHRDFLGALMSLGIERETVGDILVEDGRCVVFVKTEIADYIKSQISKIGRAGVKVSDADVSSLPKGRGFDEKEYSVSSLRLDAVVAAATGLSREKTKSVILSGNVTHNYADCQNISQAVREKDTITVRGKGKYVINGVLGETKKHRIRISIIHFR